MPYSTKRRTQWHEAHVWFRWWIRRYHDHRVCSNYYPVDIVLIFEQRSQRPCDVLRFNVLRSYSVRDTLVSFPMYLISDKKIRFPALLWSQSTKADSAKAERCPYVYKDLIPFFANINSQAYVAHSFALTRVAGSLILNFSFVEPLNR